MYVVGSNRLFYTPAGFTTGLTITGKLMDQNLVIVQDHVAFVEYEPGMYYCDITVPAIGTYVMRTFQNGVLKLVQTLQVDNSNCRFVPSDPQWGVVQFRR